MVDLITSRFNREIYNEAYKQAERSTLKNFKTGAVMFKGEDIYIKGCSHTKMGFQPLASVHAEEHCVDLFRKSRKVYDLSIFVLCIGGRNKNPAFSSKPCFNCANRLQSINVAYVYYLERTNDGIWTMNVKKPIDLIAEAESSNLRLEKYAKNMRIR
jgi:tRNA(Arg) A34 adenosine deaminase TadA